MVNVSDHKFLFIHVMKAGGTSFTEVINTNFSDAERYPAGYLKDESNPFRKMEAYLYVPGLLGAVNSAPERYRIVCGHVPYATRTLLDDDYVALTVLRDPVARTISYLKHCRRYHNEHADWPLEAIYEDDWFHASFINNYQTKLFSMTAEETLAEVRYGDYEPVLPPRSELGNGENLTPELIALGERGGGRFSMECFAASTGVIEVDNARFETARENLRATDVVGVTEDFETFLFTLGTRYGWTIGNMPHAHAGEDDDVPAALKERIARDNAMDRELHAYASALSAQRKP